MSSRVKYAIKDAIYDHVPLSVLQHVLPHVSVGQSPFLPVIRETRVIFVHVPKAAGTSLKQSLYAPRNDPGKRLRTGGHRRIVEFAAHDGQSTAEFFKFAFVRNPWDRMFSAYTYLTQGKGTSKRDRMFADAYLRQHENFEAFILSLADLKNRRRVLFYDHFRTQCYWICMPGQRQHAMDFLGRFESIQADLERLSEKMGRPIGELKKTRTSERGDFHDAFTDETRAIVADIYADDIALLKYTF